jgi:DNA-binding transcriptional ArsR family regulator
MRTSGCETFVELKSGNLFDIRQAICEHGAMPKALPILDVTDPICCAPVAAGPMSEDAALELALRLKALADPTRVRIMSMLLATPQTEICTCDLAAAVGLSEPTTSHHLSQLKKAGLVVGARRGMNVFYRARAESLSALCRVLDPACC